MNNELFRKKSLDKVQSPDELNCYLRVTTPPVWFAVIAVIALLLGLVIWGIFGRIETKTNCVVIGDGEQAVCYISESDIGNVNEDMILEIDGRDYKIGEISDNPVKAESVLSEYAMNMAGYENGEFVYEASVAGALNKGNYSGKIIMESMPAISFMLDSSD